MLTSNGWNTAKSECRDGSREEPVNATIDALVESKLNNDILFSVSHGLFSFLRIARILMLHKVQVV